MDMIKKLKGSVSEDDTRKLSKEVSECLIYEIPLPLLFDLRCFLFFANHSDGCFDRKKVRKGCKNV